MKGIISGLMAIVIAQLLKAPIKRLQTGKWDWKQIFSSGGMPSSHSAGVMSLATYIGLKLGAKSLDFALSIIFGLIVMYDAQGIRQHAGKTAVKVNELEKRIDQLSGDYENDALNRRQRQLKETLGHMPMEVLVGSILGFFTGFVSFFCLENKNK